MKRAEGQGRPRILVVAYNFPPIGAIGTMRTLRLVRHLHQAGWEVEVLTSDPRGYRAGTPVDEGLCARVPSEVKVVRAEAWRWIDGPSPPAPAQPFSDPASDQLRRREDQTSPWRRVRRILGAARALPDRDVSWLPPSVIAALRRCARPHVLYSSAPPWTGQLTALALARAWGCPWVADFRDPWARAPWREDRPAFVTRALARLERRVVARADAVVFAPPGVRAEFAQHYGERAAERFFAIPNGCDTSEFDGLVARPDADCFVLLHAGSLYGGRRDPGPLFRAIGRAIERGALDRGRFRLRMLGVDSPGTIAASVEQYRLQGVVELRARVPRRESLQQMVSAGALLLLHPGRDALPGKLHEYLAAQRPILALVDDPLLVRLAVESGVGITANPADEADIERALLECVAVARRGGAFSAPREFYDGAVHARSMEEVLLSVLGETRPGLAGYVPPGSSAQRADASGNAGAGPVAGVSRIR